MKTAVLKPVDVEQDDDEIFRDDEAMYDGTETSESSPAHKFIPGMWLG